MANLRTVRFVDGAELWQRAIAERLKASAEEQGVRTKDVAEWVRVALLATIDIVIDLDTRTFNVSSDTKPLLENLVREYLVMGVKEAHSTMPVRPPPACWPLPLQ
jgi:hypothetical protein